MNRCPRCSKFLLVFCVSSLLSVSLLFSESGERYWPQWRGPLGNGVAPDADPPLQWSEEQNIRWKVEIPGTGHSSPIVWGHQVFVTTAIPAGAAAVPKEVTDSQPRWMRGTPPSNILKFTLISLDRRTGEILWQRTAREQQPHAGTHQDGSWASNSPVTDGQSVIAFFGSNGLYAFDMNGELQWETDLGDMRTKLGFGEGSSPTLHGDKVVVNWDHEDQSFIVALDKNTGKQLWKTARDEATAWATPLIVEQDGKTQIVTNATHRIRSYDFETGELLWESSGMTDNVIPSPVYADGMLFIMSGFRGNALQAIRLDQARGDLSQSKSIAWTHDQDTPYVPSPLLHRGLLYFLKSNNAILSCFDAETGEEHYSRQRLEGIDGVYASPTAAGERVYIVGRDGTSAVLRHGPNFDILAVNELDDGFEASPALVDDQIYLRGRSNLYCIAGD